MALKRQSIAATLFSILLMMIMTLPADAESPVADADLTEIAQSGFTPIVRMLGLQNADGIEWVVTISNIGVQKGEAVVLTNQLASSLEIDHVQISTGSASIEGQSIEVLIPELQPQQTVQFSIFTHSNADAPIANNTICASADNYIGDACAVALPIMALPQTGETPTWRSRLQLLGLLLVSVSLLMIGTGLWGWQQLDIDSEPLSLATP